MPWSVGDVDKHNKGLSPNQKKQWVVVANDALKRCEAKGGKDCDAHAIRQANAAVRKSDFTEFSLTIRKAYFDEATQEMRWRADTSDTETDSYNDSMTLELFSDFLQRIATVEKPPEHFCSDYWSGGIPYLSISHYHDQNGKAVPGIVNAVYVDGNVLKAKGRYFDTPLGRACFKAVCESLHGTPDKPVRVSIAFLDYKHEHKNSSVIFERKTLDDSCDECLKEALASILDGKDSGGKRYLSGHLIHFAHTRVPVNKRTIMEVDRSMTTQKEDAESIVGEELAKEIDEKEKALVGKSETIGNTNSLVFKAEAGKCPECGKELVDGKCPECDKKEKNEKSDVITEKCDMVGIPEVYKPFGGAISLKDALDTQEAQQELWRLGDLWHMVQGVMENIFSDETIKEKASAITKIMAEFKKLIETKSIAMSIAIDKKVDKMLSILTMPEEPKPVHVLDEVLGQFKNDFDSVMLSDTTVDEKLRSLQDPINAVGNTVISVVKAESKPVTPEKAESDKLSQLTELVASLAQRMELISTQLSNPQVRHESVVTTPAAPQRRNISLPPELFAKKTESITPKLHDIIMKTV